MLVSILIINFNGATRTRACLKALEQQSLPRHRFEVIVVDNGSTDDSMAVLPKQFPWVQFIPSKINLGFAGGNNLAARHAHGSILILLNNDTLPDPFWLEELLRIQAEQPDSVIASKLVFEHDPRTINSGGVVLLRDGRGFDAGFRQLDDGRFEAGGPIFGGCGAAVTARTQPNGDIFDSWLFLYYEDLDAAWQQRLDGKPARLSPRSLVRHAHGAAAGDQSPLFRYQVERNRAVVNMRNGDLIIAIYCILVLFLKLPQIFFRVLIFGQKPGQTWRHVGAVAAAIVAFIDRLPQTLVDRYRVRNWNCRR